MDQTFLDAYETVRTRCSGPLWAALTSQEITAGIYREMRRLDDERANARAQRAATAPNRGQIPEYQIPACKRPARER